MTDTRREQNRQNAAKYRKRIKEAGDDGTIAKIRDAQKKRNRKR